MIQSTIAKPMLKWKALPLARLVQVLALNHSLRFLRNPKSLNFLNQFCPHTCTGSYFKILGTSPPCLAIVPNLRTKKNGRLCNYGVMEL